MGLGKELSLLMPPAQKLTDYGTTLPLPLASKEDERAAALARRAQQGDYDESLIVEQLTRTSSFVTPTGLKKIRGAFVVVVGLGGVGSHCTAALARSGVSKVRLIDFDQVTLSSLNRHAVATLADVGTPKVHCVRRRMEAVVPWVQWECLNEVWREDEGSRLLGPWAGKAPSPDYVVDAIDNIDSKVALLKYCHAHSINVISAMGAGCKSDPSRVFVGDIGASLEDPLSRVTRRRLRALGVSTGIPVVYSTEKPGEGKAELLPLPEEEFLKGQVNELSVLPDFRARILPVLGTMPAIFGYTIANWILIQISGYPHEAIAGKSRDKLYDRAHSDLTGLEERLARTEGVDPQGLKIPLTKDDVEYLIEEVYRGKSVISGISTRLALLRWRRPKKGYRPRNDGEGQKASDLTLNELACMTKEEAASHEREILKGQKSPEDFYDDKVLKMVEQRQQEEARYSRYR